MTILEGSVVRKRLSVLPVPPHLHVSQHQLISLVPENVSNVDATPVSEKDHLKPYIPLVHAQLATYSPQ